MAVNKVVYANQTLIDLTGDNVTPSTLLQGVKAHDKSGTSITGSVVTQTCYKGSTTPSSSLGANGDIYLKV